MKIQSLSVVFSFLIAVSAIKHGFADSSSSVSNAIISESFTQQVSRIRPDKSVLEENNYHYLFKGKPIHLQRIKNRYMISYKESQHISSPLFKKQDYFKDALFRKMKTAGRSFEIVTISKKQYDKKSSSEIIADLGAELTSDPSVLYATPVYCEPKTGEEVILTDRIIVKVKSASYDEIISVISSLTDIAFEKELMSQVLVFKCNNLYNRDAIERCMAIESIPNVIWAQPEMIIKIKSCYTPNDPLFKNQWHLQNTGSTGGTVGADMKVSSAWDIQTTADTNITIAILDDGIDMTHPDLRIVNGWNFFTNNSNTSPSNAFDNHGTAVAGIAAGIGNNGIGIAGVAAGAKIMPVKILQDDSSLTDAQVATSIYWAWTHGADVLNNSWGMLSSTPSNAINDAIIDASKLGRNGKGCPVFFSSGNSGSFFTAHKIPFGSNGTIYVGFRYKKDGSGVDGSDRVYIDNVYILNSTKDSVKYLETFSGSSLPTGWSTYGGVNGSDDPIGPIPGWSRSTVRHQQGFSAEKSSFCSGAISDNQWTELLTPLLSFSTHEELHFNLSMSTEEGHDSLIVVFYTSEGELFGTYEIGSGITESPIHQIACPAIMDSSIAVGSSTDLDFRSDYSQYDTADTDKTVDFVAPSNGGFFGTTTTDRTGSNGYDNSDYFSNFGGTSSACPAASGLAALILSKNPHLSRNKVLEVMRSTCDKIGGVTYTGDVHKEYGYGRLNSFRAIKNLPPVIIGQNPLAMDINSSLTISTTDLVIFDEKAPDGPFTLTLRNGTNYTISGTRITPTTDYTGTLRLPASINDSTYESDLCTLTVNVRSSNIAPVITSQRSVTILEDRRYKITASDLVITDADDPSGPFLIIASSGTNYTIVRDSIVPSPDFNGTLTVPVTASDGLTTSTVFNVTVTVTAVNDAPSFESGPDVDVSNTSGPYSQAWATDISKGPDDESTQSVSFTVSSTNAGLFDNVPSISESGILTFTPKNSVTGTSTVSVFCTDNGGVENGGINRSSTATFTITTVVANNPPSFTSESSVSVNEDAGAQMISWATGINPGSPEEVGQQLHFEIKSNNNPSLFTIQPKIDSIGRLSFTSAPDRFGSAQITARLYDDGGGNDSSSAHIFTITINNVNDLPSFTASGNQIVLEDAGSQTVLSWANPISAGPNETDPLQFNVTNSNPGLFLTPPSVSNTGTLSYTPAPNANGIADVRVRIFDGADSGNTASISITITEVNDAPSFRKGSDISIEELSTPYSVLNWATDISTGPADELTQTPTFNVSVTNATLFSVLPTITRSGTLSFTPSAGLTGTSTVTITLSDDGGTANGGVDSSRDTTFNISIIPVNDRPIITVAGLTEMTSGTQTAVTITATDPDGTTPSIVVSDKPSFCQTENRGSNIAIITFIPAIPDTGIFLIKVSASDGELSTDSTISMHIIAPPPGRILIRGVSSTATTRINATSGWSGYAVLTGSGYITGLKNGTYSLSISDSGYKTGYYYGTIADGRIDTITFNQHTAIPVMFSSALPLQTTSGALNAGGLVSVVIDDIDNDKKRDIVYTGTDGKIYMCKGNETSFGAPVLKYSEGFSGRNTLRCIDWNNDGLNDLLLFNVNGTVWLCRGKENGELQKDTTLFNLTSFGCTGMDIVQQSDGAIAFYTGFSDGTIKYLTLANDGTLQTSIVRDKNGQPVDVGNDADVSVFDFSGDGRMELIAGNSNGIVKVFNMKNVDTTSGSFVFSMGGIPAGQNWRVSISSGIGSDATLSMIVVSGNNGAIYRATTGVRGDVTEDGRVDVLDLQQLGIHWGKRSTDVGWTPSVNLSSNEPVTGTQIINVLDLQVLGNSWGLRK